jgi:hypothetical protein
MILLKTPLSQGLVSGLTGLWFESLAAILPEKRWCLSTAGEMFSWFGDGASCVSGSSSGLYLLSYQARLLEASKSSQWWHDFSRRWHSGVKVAWAGVKYHYPFLKP